jgi:hypothetical protein
LYVCNSTIVRKQPDRIVAKAALPIGLAAPRIFLGRWNAWPGLVPAACHSEDCRCSLATARAAHMPVARWLPNSPRWQAMDLFDSAIGWILTGAPKLTLIHANQ